MASGENYLSNHPAVTKQDSCLRCGKSRSSRNRRLLPNHPPHNLICTRRACAEAKSLLRKIPSVSATAQPMIVELHHFYHVDYAVGEMHTATRSSELQADIPRKRWAELPGQPDTSRSVPQVNSRLSPILEEPPYVNAGSKPSADAVRLALSRNIQ